MTFRGRDGKQSASMKGPGEKGKPSLRMKKRAHVEERTIDIENGAQQDKRRASLSFHGQAGKRTTLLRGLALLGTRRPVYLASLAMSLLVSTVNVAIHPLMNKRVIDAIAMGDRSLLSGALLLLAGSTVLFWLVSPLASYGAAWASKRAIWQLRHLLADHLLRLSMRYHDTHAKGEVLSLVTNDLTCLESIYDGLLYRTVENFTIGFTGLVMLFVIDWRLGAVAAGLGFASIMFADRYRAPLGCLGARLQESAQGTTTVFLDILKGVRTIKLFGLGPVMGRKLEQMAAAQADSRIEVSRKQAEQDTLVGVLSGLSTFGILIVGAFMVQRGWTTWGAVVVVSGLQNATGDLFALFPMNLARLQTQLAGVERLQLALAEAEETLPQGRYKFVQGTPGDIVLEAKGLSFGYKKDEALLRGLSFSLRKGEVTALVGGNGAGKSTLVKLLLGLYAPCDGLVGMAGEQSGAATVEAWRDRIGYVPQQAQLFAGTVEENIGCGWADATMREVEAAARLAGIHEWIEGLPQGYRTMLAEDGGNLSGGQKQRIAIARALVKQANLLLLDEWTSALDGETETALMRTLRELAMKRAVLVVAHRESTLRHVDTILRLESGRVCVVQ